MRASLETLRERMHDVRTLVGGVAVLLVAGSISVTTPADVYASSSGCTGVNGGITCFYIYGKGLNVSKFSQSRVSFSQPLWICNYQARFTVYKKRGDKKYLWRKYSSKHQGCQYSPRATRSLAVNRDFPNKSYACGGWVEDGSSLGVACNTIHK